MDICVTALLQYHCRRNLFPINNIPGKQFIIKNSKQTCHYNSSETPAKTVAINIAVIPRIAGIFV